MTSNNWRMALSKALMMVRKPIVPVEAIHGRSIEEVEEQQNEK